ncbi:MAG: hypothetical protein ACK4FG_07695 [Brevundimonas sp.]
MPKFTAYVAAISLAAMASATSAQNYSTDRYDVGELRDSEGCFIGGDWSLPGRSQINFEIDQLTNGELYVGVWSYGWSRPTADTSKVLGVVFWPTGGGERQVFVMIAVPTGVQLGDGEPGLFAIVPEERRAEFLSTFSGSQSFTVVTRDMDAAEGTPFDTILEGNLAGSSLAVSRMQNCVRDVRQREDARRQREAGVAHIERDPFRRGE